MIDPALIERFDNPPTEYGPTPLWWWSGGTVTEEGILWQLRRFADGGILNLVLMNLAPSGPTYGAMPDDPVWFGERWWELFRYACEQAAALGIRLWFYDQIGFSGANLQGRITAAHPEAAGRSLRSRIAEADAEGRVALEPREHLIGAFDAEEGASGWRSVDLESAVEPGRRVRIVSWRETSFDYLDRAAVALLIDAVHGEYERRVPEHVGTTIVGSFQDELPAMPTWSARFAERFRAECGYELLPVLPALWDRSSERSAGIRADYHRVRTLLAEEAFFRPLGEWHRERGMLLGADQMNPARAGVPTQSTQLYGDYFTTHRWFDAVGSDHEGDARVHSSMADLYDHPRVWIESFHSSGWGGTLEETWDWLIPFFRSGANLYNPHASYYGLQAGWFEWAPPSTDFRQPYYEVYPQFARAVARVSALLTWGRHAVDVGLHYPSRTIQAQLPPDLPIDHFLDADVGPEHPGVDAAHRSYLDLAGRNDWFRSEPGLLDRAGIDFDVIDDDSLRRAEARDGTAQVNGFAFRTVILPTAERIDTEVARRLIELLDDGGRVIAVAAAPALAAGSDGDDVVAARLAAHPRLETVADAEAAVRALDGHRTAAWAAHGVRAQRSGDHGVALVPGAFPNATAFPLRTGPGAGGWDDIDFDAERYDGSQDLRVDGRVAEAELWNPATGDRTPAAVTADGDGGSTIRVDGAGAPLLIVVWRLDDDDAAAADDRATALPPAAEAHSVELPLTWTQELVPTLDNRWGDFALPAGDAAIPLELWQLDLVDGERRVPTRVTFGQEVLVSEALPHAAAEPPLDPERAARIRDGAALADERWTPQRYSASSGRDSSTGAPQDPKGFIGEEFLVHPTPGDGEEVGLRALLRVAEPGAYELVVSSACTARAWLDGVELPLDGSGYDTVARIELADRVAVLELRLDEPALAIGQGGRPPQRMTASLALHRPGRRVARPEFMAAGPLGLDGGTATFRRPFRLDADAPAARIVTGAPGALTVVLDGRPVARQEKVEYYEGGLGDIPMYFTHELGALEAGEHVLEVITEGVEASTPLFVDLVADAPAAPVAVPSGADWTVGAAEAAVALAPARTGGTTHARAARRPHPLPAAHWLSGPPEIGSPAVAVELSASSTPRAETFEVLLPPGTATVELSADPDSVRVDGRDAELRGRTVVLDPPTTEPAVLSATLPERAFSTSGAAWEGPLVVTTVPAPAHFVDWSEQGLASWSGAVRYSAELSTDRAETLRLDLGRVRGAVTIDVDGARVGSAFCAPFVVELPIPAAGEHRVDVTVYGTLAPRYASATQSTFFVPSQLRTGLHSPIRVERTADTEETA